MGDAVSLTISRSTVANVLKESGMEPAPERERGTTWKDFINAHKDVLFATDFFTQEVWQSFGHRREEIYGVVDRWIRHRQKTPNPPPIFPNPEPDR